MTELKGFGRFCELFDGPNDYPSIATLVSDTADEFEDKIVAYLESGELLEGCMGLEADVLDPSRGAFLDCHIVTDGIWQWRLDLAYYVRTYHLRIPREVIDHMRLNQWKVPPVEAMDRSLFE